MAYKPPTLSELIAKSRANIQSKLIGTKSFIRNAYITAIAYTQAAIAAGLYHFLEWIYKQTVPHLAEDEQFIPHAKECGIFRKAATIAKGKVKIFTDKPVTIPKGTELQRIDGALYIVTQEEKGTGEIMLQVESANAGVEQNVAADETLSFIKPILYVQNVAVVTEITGGSDIEPMAEMRERYLYFCQYPPMGGSKFDYVRWCRDNAGVSRAWCFPRIYGGNTVGVSWVYDGRDEILPNSLDAQLVLDYIDHHRDPVTNTLVGAPAGAEVIYTPLKLKPLNPEIRLIPDTEATRRNVQQALDKAVNAVATPGGVVPRSHLTQAISNSAGEYDHRLISPTADEILSDELELIILGEIQWR